MMLYRKRARLSAEDPGLDSRPDQTNDIKNGICCLSAKHATYMSSRLVGPVTVFLVVGVRSL